MVRTAPPIDRTLYTDWNAMMASAALQGRTRARTMPSLSEFAIRSLERIALLCYRPGGGMAHYHDGEAQVRGLLDDQIAMAAAQLDAFEATGDIVSKCWPRNWRCTRSNRCGTGTAAASSIARRIKPRTSACCGERRKPFAANCAAARLLRSARPQPQTSRAIASWPNGHSQPSARAPPARGPLAADYVLAVRAAGQ